MNYLIKLKWVFIMFLISGFASAQTTPFNHDLLEAENRGDAEYVLSLNVVDRESGELIQGTKAILINESLNTSEESYSEDGWFAFSLKPGHNYRVEVEKKFYLKRKAQMNSCHLEERDKVFCAVGFNSVFQEGSNISNQRTIDATIKMDKIEIDKIFQLENIYYDLAKWDIRPDAAKELNKLVMILKDNPSIQIELGSHTDSRGSDSYNLKLSQQRAQSAVEYIISQGVVSQRLEAKGYGETLLVNGCRNRVRCSDAKHQQNRRTEFKIIAVDYGDL